MEELFTVLRDWTGGLPSTLTPRKSRRWVRMAPPPLMPLVRSCFHKLPLDDPSILIKTAGRRRVLTGRESVGRALLGSAGTSAIVEHRVRTVTYFFHLLLKVHNSDRHYILGPTLLQLGKGSRLRGTHGCHSTITPNLLSCPRGREGDPDVEWDESFLSTFFGQMSNSVVELSEAVNKVDSRLELILRPDALEIINRVASSSKPAYGPEEGLSEFITQALNALAKLDGAPADVVEAQRRGFSAALDRENIDPQFVGLHVSAALTPVSKSRLPSDWSAVTPDTKASAFRRVQDLISGS